MDKIRTHGILDFFSHFYRVNGQTENSVFKEVLSGIQGGKVLDIGCGSGQFIEILAETLGAYESITGIDVDESVLLEAGKKFPEESFRFLNANAQSLPFESNSFDLVTVSKALHHVENDRLALSEMKRVLKPGGFLLINEMIRDGLTASQQSHSLYHHLRSEIDQILGVNHNPTYPRSDLLDLIYGVGLQDMMVMDYAPRDGATDDPAQIDEYISRMQGWLEELGDHPGRKEFSNRMAVLQEHFREHGISRPVQVIALGKK
jgi:SAM-dependent methyltransferase